MKVLPLILFLNLLRGNAVVSGHYASSFSLEHSAQSSFPPAARKPIRTRAFKSWVQRSNDSYFSLDRCGMARRLSGEAVRRE